MGFQIWWGRMNVNHLVNNSKLITCCNYNILDTADFIKCSIDCSCVGKKMLLVIINVSVCGSCVKGGKR